MTIEITNVEKISKLPWSIGSNAANTVFVQLTFFGSVFVLFLNELNFSKSQVGLVLSLLPFSGLVALIVAPAVARFGYKRTYLTFFGSRNLVAVLLLITPWVLAAYGVQSTFIFVAIIVGVFAVLRAVGVTAAFPWIQEYVPNSVRGKYSGINNLIAMLTGFIVVTTAGAVLELTVGLTGYMILIAVGVLFGAVAVWAATKIPGGAPTKHGEHSEAASEDLKAAFHDRDFMRYLGGTGLITLAIVALNSFVPLFLVEEVGISSGNVVFIQTGVLLGGLISTFLWGWTADRYGSRPVMLWGAFIWAMLPFFWILMPRNSPLSIYIALGIALLQGIGNMAWIIGGQRLLFVSVVPSEKKTEYMALYFALIGVAGGLSQLFAGQIVELSSEISAQFLFFTADPYTILFILGIILPISSALLLRTVRADTRVTMEQFAGLFLRGNPFQAMTSLVGYQLARDERSVVAIAERLGETRSPLTVEELLELLNDPRYNVRVEAIISIARTRPDPRLTEALCRILTGTELALTAMAAWALGRIGDERAIGALRDSLDASYRSIQAHSVRALGTLGDTEIIPELLQRLETETDKGLQMAYASALGNLHAEEAAKQLLQLLKSTENQGARMELALSLARLVGEEGNFIQLLRQTRDEFGTAASQAVTALRRRVEKEIPNSDDLVKLLNECADVLAHEDLEKGAALLHQISRLSPKEIFSEQCSLILDDCAANLDELGPSRPEYILLTLHTLNVGWPS